MNFADFLSNRTKTMNPIHEKQHPAVKSGAFMSQDEMAAASGFAIGDTVTYRTSAKRSRTGKVIGFSESFGRHVFVTVRYSDGWQSIAATMLRKGGAK